MTTFIRFSWLAFLVLSAAPISAFEQDSHYYLRFGLSLATCFDWHESHLIASGDWGMDENLTTAAEMDPVLRRNKIDWHAFGHSDKRFHELWYRSRDETDTSLKLIKLGQYLHFVEDWEAHAGYGTRLGHARDTFRGLDPDSLGSSDVANRRMAQSALDILLHACREFGRLDPDIDARLVRIVRQLDEDGLMNDLFQASDPAWKQRKFSGFRKESDRVIRINRIRVERMINRYFTSRPEKRVPADFRPGNPEHGLPPSLGLRFDGNGRIAHEVPESAIAAAVLAAQLALAPDVAASLDRVRFRDGGWRVRFDLANEGEEPAMDVVAEVVVVDSRDEHVLGSARRAVGEIAPGRTVGAWIDVPAESRVERRVLVGIFARTGEDADALDNTDWWMSKEVAEAQPDELMIDVDPDLIDDTLEPVEFVGDPKTVVLEDGVCSVATVLALEGDSTTKLAEPAVRLVSATDNAVAGFEGIRTTPFSATLTDRQLVAGKAFSCFEPEAGFCEGWRLLFGADEVHVEWTVGMIDGEVFSRRAALGPLGQATLDRLCFGA